MRTIEIQVYKYDELSEEAKQRVLERHYDINVDHDWWDDTVGCFREDNQWLGFVDVYFDLGRGRSIEITKPHIEDEVELLRRTLGKKMFVALSLDIDMNEIELDFDKTPCIFPDYNEQFNEEIVEQINDALAAYWEELKEKLLKTLDEGYEYLTSEEAIKETLEINDYEFDEGGKII